MLWEATIGFRLLRGRMRVGIPAEQRARGRRRTEWAGRPAADPPPDSGATPL
jgi:hypothetical protein